MDKEQIIKCKVCSISSDCDYVNPNTSLCTVCQSYINSQNKDVD